MAVLALAAAVRWTPPRTAAELRPRPDALEYEQAAHNMLHGDGYCLVIDGKKYPPRYPFGFSVLLLPALLAGGDEPGDGIVVVLASGLVAVAATWALARTAGGPASGLAAALLLALAPLHVAWGRQVMSDVPCSALLAVIALAALLAWQRRSSSVTWAALGFAGGLATTVRATCGLALAPAIVLAALAGRIPAVAGLGAGAALGVAPLLVYQAVRFGSPLRDGYAAWVPLPLLGAQYVLGPPVFGGDRPNLEFYASLLAGLGSLYPWQAAVLVATGAVLGAWRAGPARAVTWLAGGTVLAVVALVLPFAFQGDRFLVAVLPLLAVLAGIPFGGRQSPGVRLVAVALALSAAIQIGRGDQPFPVVAPDHDEAAALRAFDDLVEPNAVLIAHSEPYLVRRLFRRTTDRRWLPIGDYEHERLLRRASVRPYGEVATDAGWMLPPFAGTQTADAIANQVRVLLGTGRPVYISPLLPHEVPAVLILLNVLGDRFLLESVADDLPAALYRVSEE